MKKYIFKIDKYTAGKLFAPIRTKRHLLSVLFKSIKIIQINDEPSETLQEGKLILVVSKMSRLFFITKNKFFSITFPFIISKNEDGFKITYKDKFEVDNKVSSELISLLMYDEFFDSSCGFKFIDTFFDQANVQPKVWSLFIHLLMNEDGYIRYDYDIDRANGLLHPINHYDIFYSSNPTFKIGLKHRIAEDTLIDLLSLETDCHFID